MRKIEYDIKYDEDGNPYIYLENGNVDIEDIFYSFEMVKLRIYSMLNDPKNKNIDPKGLQELALTADTVNYLSNLVAKMVSGSNDTLDEVNDILNSKE